MYGQTKYLGKVIHLNDSWAVNWFILPQLSLQTLWHCRMTFAHFLLFLYILPFHNLALFFLLVAQEEHFVSILNFSWPQVTCVTQCPISGSRVVFVSFCDKSKQASFLEPSNIYCIYYNLYNLYNHIFNGQNIYALYFSTDPEVCFTFPASQWCRIIFKLC